MMWIAGAYALDGALRNLEGGPIVRFFATQFDHAKWEGFHFYDLIFPLFIFLLGVAIPLSVGRLAEREGRAAALRRVVRRAGLMYLLGLFYYGGLSTPFDQIRLLGVLQRLALCYLGASLLFLYFRPRTLVAVCAGLLVGYWALLTFVPVPGFGAGDFAETHNLSDWIDSRYLPGRKWRGDHDPEGLLSTLPALASCLLGVFAGLHLRDSMGRVSFGRQWFKGSVVISVPGPARQAAGARSITPSGGGIIGRQQVARKSALRRGICGRFTVTASAAIGKV